MRVLWISQNLPYPPKTGVLQRNYHLIREASTFAEVHLVAILKRNILPSFDEASATRELHKLCARVEVVRLPAEVSRLRFFGVLFRSVFTQAPFTANWATSPVLRDVLARALSSHHFDVVYFDSIGLAGYRPLVNGPAAVMNHHNIESHLFQRRRAFEPNPLKRAFLALEAGKLRRYEAAVASEFDVHLVVSELDGARLREICPGASVAAVANGVDVDYFRSTRAAAEHGHLVLISGMNWFPNRDAVLHMIREIWPALTGAIPGLRLTIVGASPPRAALDLAARDPRVTVTGFVDDVRPYMERAHVYLCPMRDGGGTRLKIIDALSMGKAIVATTMAIEGIDVEPERELLVADSSEAFVRQVGRILTDPALCARLGANARAFAERQCAWAVIGRHMQDAFVRVARSRQAHA
jgi:glycosyltransferase involved in cell wall biosynthesis